MREMITALEDWLAHIFSNIKLVEKGLLGLEGSYVELLTILALGLLAVIPVIVPKRRRQMLRHLNQLFGIFIFIFVVFTCLGVFGMIRNFYRGLNEIGQENIVALYYCSVPVTVLVMSMLFGPTFCGWMCPTGALQEFVGMLTRRWTVKQKKKGYPFSWLKLAMALAVMLIFLLWIWRLSVTRLFFVEDASIYWSEVLILLLLVLVWRMDRWDGKLRRLRVVSFVIIAIAAFASLRITSPVHFGFSKVYDPASFLAPVLVVLAALVVPRIWCRYLCPWRCAISWASKNSVRRLEYNPAHCTKCGRCDELCDVDAVRLGVIDEKECHMCMKCVDGCPGNCISIKDRW